MPSYDRSKFVITLISLQKDSYNLILHLHSEKGCNKFLQNAYKFSAILGTVLCRETSVMFLDWIDIYFTLNLTIERKKDLGTRNMMPFCRSYTIHILGKHSVVTSMHSRLVYSVRVLLRHLHAERGPNPVTKPL